MTKTFLPDYASRRVGCDYHALYRFFEGEDWHHVCADGAPAVFGDAVTARDAAKAVLRRTLNPTISGHRSAHRAAVDAAEEFFATKFERVAREHTARKRGVRDVVFVQTKGKRHAK